MTVQIRRVFAGLAILFLVIFALIGFGALDSLADDRAGYLGVGLAFFVAALFP